MHKIGLTLGPVLFNWDADRLRAFYKGIAENSKFDRVHLCEVVCGKRTPFTDAVWADAIERLEAAGKAVVLSTLALPASQRERKSVTDLCRDGTLVEMNDVTALPARAGRPFVAGPLLNVYNEGAAQFLAARGAATLCTPVELPLTSVAVIARACPELEIEVFAFGRLPLALSSRCYHARLHGLHKDSCQFVCEKDPDGLTVDTIDGQHFLAVNGVQTLSQGRAGVLPHGGGGHVLRHPALAAFAPHRRYVRGERDLPRPARRCDRARRGPLPAFRDEPARRAHRWLYARRGRLCARGRRLRFVF